jgi:hypothetical protein
VAGQFAILSGGLKPLLKDVEKLVEALMLIFHILGGQPARGTELTQIRHANTLTNTRNIFIYAGILMFITAYKGMTLIGSSKFIPRFLPFYITSIYVRYVVYILPAILFLQGRGSSEQLPIASQAPSHFLFRPMMHRGPLPGFLGP